MSMTELMAAIAGIIGVDNKSDKSGKVGELSLQQTNEVLRAADDTKKLKNMPIADPSIPGPTPETDWVTQSQNRGKG